MNIQANLFKTLNIAKIKSGEYEEKVKSGSREPMELYYSAYYSGAYTIAKILIKIYNGELTDEQLDHLNKAVGGPKGIPEENPKEK